MPATGYARIVAAQKLGWAKVKAAKPAARTSAFKPAKKKGQLEQQELSGSKQPRPKPLQTQLLLRSLL
jgi:hypothetical protein